MSFFVSFFDGNGFAVRLDSDQRAFFVYGIDGFQVVRTPFFVFAYYDYFRIFRYDASCTNEVTNDGFCRSTFRPLRRSLNVFLFLVDDFRGGDEGLLRTFFLYCANGVDMARSYL